jgi:hypothetical protein
MSTRRTAPPSRRSPLRLAPLTITSAAMANDELEALRRITKRRQRAEAEWQTEIIRLFEAGRNIEEIAAAAGVRYDVVLAIVRPK